MLIRRKKVFTASAWFGSLSGPAISSMAWFAVCGTAGRRATSEALSGLPNVHVAAAFDSLSSLHGDPSLFTNGLSSALRSLLR